MADTIIDTDVIKKSVTADETAMAKRTVMWMGGFYLPSPLITLPPDPPPWWTLDRDATLLQALRSEDKWSNAVAIAATKCASMSWDVDGDVKLRVNRSHELISGVDGMQGWTQFVAKQVQSFLCTDNGSFIEIVRATKSVGSRIVGLLHLDSRRCFRTGDPQIPVLYRDRIGRVHELRDYQVITIADMPTPQLTFNGVGFCATSRAYSTIFRMATIERYIAEKVSGRKPLELNIVSGMSTKNLQLALQAGDEDANAKGLVNYMGVMVVGTNSDVPLSNLQIPLAGLPENFDLAAERNNARLEYANAIGLDIQDLQPGAIGGSLGSATQSQVLDDKAKGKGLAYWRSSFAEQLNLKVFPVETTFAFSERDYRDELNIANAQAARANVRSTMVRTGEIDSAMALQMAVDSDDAPAEFLAVDQTQDESLTSDEKPDAEDETGTAARPVQRQKPTQGKKPVPPKGNPIAVASTAKEYRERTALKQHDGAMVALFLPVDEMEVLASYASIMFGANAETADQLHLTLVYIGKASDWDAERMAIHNAILRVSGYFGPISGKINGIGRFAYSADGETTPIYANYDSPDLPAFRQAIMDELRIAGWSDKTLLERHGFTPHITLAYLPNSEPIPNQQLPMMPVTFTDVTVAWADSRSSFAFAGNGDDLMALTLKAARTALATVTPSLSRLPDTGGDRQRYYAKVTNELRAYMQTLRTTCQEYCPVDSGALRDSVRYEIKGAGTRDVEGVLYAGNQDRPEVVVRSNLFGRRGFGPKNPDGVLAFEGKDGETVFVKHVAAAEGNDWFARAWDDTAAARQQMTARIGAIAPDLIAADDVDMANAEHIDGYNPDRPEKIPTEAVTGV